MVMTDVVTVWLTVIQAAAEAQVSVKTIYKEVRASRLRAARIGGREIFVSTEIGYRSGWKNLCRACRGAAMTCAVVCAPRAQQRFITQTFAGCAVRDVIRGGGKVYVLSLVDQRDSDTTFMLGDALLAECRFFADESAARQWVAADIALQAAPTRKAQ